MISKIKKSNTDKLELDPKNIPRHVAIIMDGNGRWAKRRGLPRTLGHRAGVKSVERAMKASIELGIDVLTLYTFSTENWSRPKTEINSLMELLYNNLMGQREQLIKNNIQLRISGDLSKFPDQVRREINKTIRETADKNALILNLALGYSSREEILQVCRVLAQEAEKGTLKPEEITESVFSSHLQTAGLPDPDLLIRTSGEYRLSNFLLWQCSYTELHFTNTLWPNFNKRDLKRAILSYQQRERRFGGIGSRDIQK
jgi:undecaprenyl diphosphate synthase